MARGRKHTAEQIVNLLRQVEVSVANGKTLAQARKEAEIVEQTYYRWITALLRRTGWQVGKDRFERIWRREGLKVPKKQKPRGRLWLNDGSCVRLRPEHRNDSLKLRLRERENP